MKKSVALLSALLVIACMLTFSGCSLLKDAAELQAYDFGSDSIPTINSVVGQRTVTGVETGTVTGGTYKKYTYSSETVSEDLIAYLINNLLKNGWHALVDFDLNTVPGTAQIAIESKDAGQIIIMDISYEQGKYTIKLTKGEGTLTLN